MAPGRILLVEDGATYAKLASIVLRASGHEVTWASTAEQGLEFARANPPDLILMDINLPGMDGFHAVGILRLDSRTRRVPAVALTADRVWSDQDRERARKAGFDDYLEKPMDESEFRALVDRFLPVKGGR